MGQLCALPPQLVEAARRVVEANIAAGRKVAVAESCTGGLVAASLTEIPGSSAMFEAGYITYSNEAKLKLLGVSRDVLETFGAVSVAVAWGMARGALEQARQIIATWRTDYNETRPHSSCGRIPPATFAALNRQLTGDSKHESKTNAGIS